VNTVAFSPNCGLLASGCDDGLVRMWDRIYGRCVTLEGHTRSIRSVKFSPDGNILASGSEDGTTRLWKLADHSCRLLNSGAGVNAIAFSPDGACLASGGRGGDIILWDANDGRFIRSISEWHFEEITSVAFSPDGRTLAAAIKVEDMEEGNICFWDLLNDGNNGVAATIVDSYESIVNTITYSPDGRYLASGGGINNLRINNLRLWNAADRRSCVAVLHEGHSHEVHSLSFSPNGKLLASGSYDGSIRLWSVENKTCLLALPNHHMGGVRDVTFSPDGQTLASAAGFVYPIRLWNPREEKNRDKRVDWENLIFLWNCKP
jgi:WD40 repeat protein